MKISYFSKRFIPAVCLIGLCLLGIGLFFHFYANTSVFHVPLVILFFFACGIMYWAIKADEPRE